jgi:hypothetical protein
VAIRPRAACPLTDGNSDFAMSGQPSSRATHPSNSKRAHTESLSLTA